MRGLKNALFCCVLLIKNACPFVNAGWYLWYVSTPLDRILFALTDNRCRNRVWGLLLDSIGCGPLDGGCYIFAKAIQRRLPGSTLCVVRGHALRLSNPIDQHYVVGLPDGHLLDADGLHTYDSFPAHYAAAECVCVTEIIPISSTEEEMASVDRVGAHICPIAINSLSDLIGEIIAGGLPGFIKISNKASAARAKKHHIR